jgi:hypothetical protein
MNQFTAQTYTFDTPDTLKAELLTFYLIHGITEMSPDEAIATQKLAPHHVAYLEQFIVRWDMAMDF